MWGKKIGAVQGEILAEPLTYVREWKLARIIGNESRITQYLSQLKHLDEGGTLSTILRDLVTGKAKNEPSLKIIDEEPLSIFGRRYHYLNGNHEESLMVGSLPEILLQTKTDPYNSDLNTESVQKQSEQASQQGFLVLGMAWANVRVTKNTPTNYKLLGLVLIEPTVAKDDFTTAQPTRFYSGAHPTLATHIVEQALGLKIERSLAANELSTLPLEWQKQIKATQLVGECPALLKLQLKNFWQAQGTALTHEPFLEVR